MDSIDSGNKRDSINEEDIIKRDAETPAPEVRAGYIYKLLKEHGPELTNWDLLCFCSEYLASQLAVYDWLSPMSVRIITIRVMEAHYYRDDIPETGVKVNV